LSRKTKRTGMSKRAKKAERLAAKAEKKVLKMHWLWETERTWIQWATAMTGQRLNNHNSNSDGDMYGDDLAGDFLAGDNLESNNANDKD
jgi:hypothetical protein